MEETLAFRTARRHVNNFAGESQELMKRHREAVECWECQAFLQLGIDAFDWLVRADAGYREAVYRRTAEYNPEVDGELRRLFTEWLNPCTLANEWITVQLERGYTLDNLNRFRDCESEVRAIVDCKDEDSMSDALRELRDKSLKEYHDGQTAEFI